MPKCPNAASVSAPPVCLPATVQPPLPGTPLHPQLSKRTGPNLSIDVRPQLFIERASQRGIAVNMATEAPVGTSNNNAVYQCLQKHSL